MPSLSARPRCPGGNATPVRTHLKSCELSGSLPLFCRRRRRTPAAHGPPEDPRRRKGAALHLGAVGCCMVGGPSAAGAARRIQRLAPLALCPRGDRNAAVDTACQLHSRAPSVEARSPARFNGGLTWHGSSHRHYDRTRIFRKARSNDFNLGTSDTATHGIGPEKLSRKWRVSKTNVRETANFAETEVNDFGVRSSYANS